LVPWVGGHSLIVSAFAGAIGSEKSALQFASDCDYPTDHGENRGQQTDHADEKSPSLTLHFSDHGVFEDVNLGVNICHAAQQWKALGLVVGFGFLGMRCGAPRVVRLVGFGRAKSWGNRQDRMLAIVVRWPLLPTRIKRPPLMACRSEYESLQI
jgi:hypothetical protein